MKKITIKDIAKKSGVAISTVSYALNNSPKVSNETKEKILKVAEKLNFNLNGSARDLKKQTKDLIGIFVPGVEGPYYSEIIHGIQKYAQENKFGVIIVTDYGTESTAKKFLLEGRVDGAIIMAPSIAEEILLRCNSKFPIVVLDRKISGDNIYSVLLENENGIFQVLEYLKKISAKKIFVIEGHELAYDNNERKAAIEKYRKNFPFESVTFFSGNFTELSGYDLAKENFSKNNLPDAIISFNDEMAIGIITYFKEIKINIPTDVSIIGFDDIHLGEYITPKLSTVSYSKEKYGNTVAKILIDAINGKKDIQKISFIKTKLVIRES